jgi:hypothetical protein
MVGRLFALDGGAPLCDLRSHKWFQGSREHRPDHRMTDPEGIQNRQVPHRRFGPSGAVGIGWVPYLALCGAGLTMGLAWIGPRAAEGLGTLSAVAFWGAHVGPALALLALTQTGLARIPRVAVLSGLGQVLLAAIVASLLFTPVALVVDSVFRVEQSVDDATEPLLLAAAREFAQFAVPFCLTWTLINAPSLMRIETGNPEPQPRVMTPANEVPPPALAAFWSRIPRRLGRDLVALSAELHYLRVHTTLGDTLILYPFGRATDELGEARGIRIHRSHWVALDHVQEVRNEGGRMICRMVGGLDLPVSRTYRVTLKEALRASVAAASASRKRPE